MHLCGGGGEGGTLKCESLGGYPTNCLNSEKMLDQNWWEVGVRKWLLQFWSWLTIVRDCNGCKKLAIRFT